MLKAKRWSCLLLILLILTVTGCSMTNRDALNTSASDANLPSSSLDTSGTTEEQDKGHSLPPSSSSTSSDIQTSSCVPEGWKAEKAILNTVTNDQKNTIAVQFCVPEAWAKEDDVVGVVNYFDTTWRVFTLRGGHKIENEEMPYEEVDFLIVPENEAEYKTIGQNKVLSLCWGLPPGVFGNQYTYYLPHEGYLYEFCFYEPEDNMENMPTIFEQVMGTISLG